MSKVCSLSITKYESPEWETRELYLSKKIRKNITIRTLCFSLFAAVHSPYAKDFLKIIGDGKENHIYFVFSE